MKRRYRNGMPLPLPLPPLRPLPREAKPGRRVALDERARSGVDPLCLPGPGTHLIASHLFLQLQVWGRH